MRTFYLVFALLLALPASADIGPPDLSWGGDGSVEEPSCGTWCSPRVERIVSRAGGQVLLLVRDDDAFTISPEHIYTYRLRAREADGTLASDFAHPTLFRVGSFDGRAALAIQPDGKIIAAGLSDVDGCSGFGCPKVLVVVRLLPDGTPDSSFGTNGRFTRPFHTQVVKAIGVLEDGRIQVVADAVYRLTAQGVLDAAYGNAGVGPSIPFPAEPVIVLRDGRVVYAVGGFDFLRLARLDPEGEPDSTFNGGGSRDYAPASGIFFVSRTLVMQGTRMVVGGTVSSGELVLFRVLADGTPDTGFGPGGFTRQPVGTPQDVVLLAVDPQQRIVAASRGRGDASLAQLQRVREDGLLDTFDGATSVPTGVSLPLAMQILPSSKALVASLTGSTVRLGTSALEDDREFARQQYRDFLAREGDPLGVQYWRDRTLATSRDVVIEEFLRSPEFEGRVAPVMRLYLAYFLRVPDYAGLQFWVDFSRTESLEGISDAFASSPEFAARYGSTTDEEFVALVYQNVLGRAPDTAGRDFWVGQLASGARTRGQVMVAFSESAEFIESSRSEVLVAMLYAGMLRREPDAAGFDFWTDYIDSGESPNLLIRNFRESSEYEERFAP
jgi:uncharacterized delta-60 repeat protein